MAISSTETAFELPAQPAVDETVTIDGPATPLPVNAAASSTAAAGELTDEFQLAETMTPASAPTIPPGGPYQQPMWQQPYPPMFYPQQTMMYPMGPMGYPQQGMPYPMGVGPQSGQQPGFGQPQFSPPGQSWPSAPQAEESRTAAAAALPAIRLPDPSTTGAQPAPAPVAPAAATGEQAAPKPADQQNPAQKAAEIIKQHMRRRPNT
jgi:hypothetical protein